MKSKYLVFDLDGTLVESLSGIACAVNLALTSLGKATHHPHAIRGMIGKGATELCAKALGAEHSHELDAQVLQEMERAFAREYAQTLSGDGTKAFPGIMGMLSKLAAQGAHLAILSNKPQAPTSRIVQAIFKTTPFTHVLGFDKGRFPRKPDPAALHFIADEWGVEIGELTLIGDSIHDAKTAANAGCQLALVAWGYSQIEPLLNWSQEKHCPIFGTVEDLSRYLNH